MAQTLVGSKSKNKNPSFNSLIKKCQPWLTFLAAKILNQWRQPVQLASKTFRINFLKAFDLLETATTPTTATPTTATPTNKTPQNEDTRPQSYKMFTCLYFQRFYLHEQVLVSTSIQWNICACIHKEISQDFLHVKKTCEYKSTVQVGFQTNFSA